MQPTQRAPHSQDQHIEKRKVRTIANDLDSLNSRRKRKVAHTIKENKQLISI